MNISASKNDGYALVELLFYTSLFVVISLLVINVLITMTRSFKEITILKELGNGSTVMERISRETRKAFSVNTIGANSLKLNTLDDNNLEKTVEFLLSNGNVQLIENNILIDNLNTQNITITDLVFLQVTTANSQAVKMHMTVRSNSDKSGRSVDFYDTVVLRGSY